MSSSYVIQNQIGSPNAESLSFLEESILQHRKKGIDDVPYLGYINRLIKFNIKGLEMLNKDLFISRTVKNGWMLVMYIFSLKTMPETPKEANSMM